MKKTQIIFIFLILASITLSGCSKENEKKVYYFDKDGNMTTVNPTKAEEVTVDKLEIYYFHRTARCYSCNTAEEYISKTIFDFFPNQVKNGIIDFREINVDSSENKEIAKKFQATGSSLFINKIIDGQDNIEQDTNIWRLLNNEVKFKEYLETKINSYLGL